LCVFAEPEKWTQIQAPLKFYKLIVDELSNLYPNTDDVEEGSDEVSDLINTARCAIMISQLHYTGSIRGIGVQDI
jgi:hypothetical protein